MLRALNLTEFYGFIAAILTTIAFLPQLYKTWTTKSAEDVSLITLIIGLICWIVYGIKINSTPILVANIVTFIFNFTILILKLIYSDPPKEMKL